MKKALIIGGTISVILGCILALTPKETSEIEVGVVQEVDLIQEAEEVQQPEVYPVIVKTLFKPREFTYDEAQMLMKIAQAEAGNQGTQGMILIMAVVLNRTRDEDWPSTIREVIYQEHNFYTAGMNTPISTEANEALAYVESGQPLDTEIIAFEVSTSNSLERYFEYAYTVGDHNFYKKGGDKDGE